MKRLSIIFVAVTVITAAVLVSVGSVGRGEAQTPTPTPPPTYVKESMPDFGQHSEGWCWVASAANSFWWWANSGGLPGSVPGAFAGIDPISQGLGPNGAADPYYDGNDAGPIPVPGYRRLLREIAQTTFRDINQDGIRQPDGADGIPGSADDETLYVYSQGVQKWDYLVGLRDYIAARGVPLIVHDITDPAAVVTGGCIQSGRNPNPGPDGIPGTGDDVTVSGVPTTFAAPTLADYKRELSRSQDVLLMILFAGPDGTIGTADDYGHVVTGVGYDNTAVPPTITVSDPATHAAVPPHDDTGGPVVDHNNAPGHVPSPYDTCTVTAVGPPWQVTCPAGGLGQVVNLIFISPPPIEVDYFPDSVAEVTINTPMGPDTVTLTGPTTVIVDLPGIDDTDGDGREQVQTEIVQMELTGTSALLGPVTVRIRDSAKHPFQPSAGEIEEAVDTQAGRLDVPPFDPAAGAADSFFDVYFEIETPLGILHNDAPKRMETTISEKPPAPGETYESPSVIPLLDESDNPTGVEIAATFHTPVGGGGGIAEAISGADSAVETPGSSSARDYTAPIAAAVVAGAVIALAAGGWYVRRRRLQ